jgi:hypothetical protein
MICRVRNEILASHLNGNSVWRCPSDRKQLFEQTGAVTLNNLLNGQDRSSESFSSTTRSAFRF